MWWKRNCWNKLSYGEGLSVAPPSLPPSCVCVFVCEWKCHRPLSPDLDPSLSRTAGAYWLKANRFPPSLSVCTKQFHLSFHLLPSSSCLNSFITSWSDQTSGGCLMSVLDSRTRVLVRGLSSLVPQRQTSHSSSPAMEPFAEVSQHWFTSSSPWDLPLFALCFCQ